MRVLLVGEYSPDAQPSMQKYGEWLKRALEAHGHRVNLIRPKAVFSRLSKHSAAHSTAAKYLGYIDKFLIFLPSLRRIAGQYDLAHVLDHSNSMYLTALRGAPGLITCHDLLAVRSMRGDFSEVSIGWSGKLLQRWILSGMRRARNVLCVSHKTADDLKILAGDSNAQVRVVYNALNWDYKPGAALPRELLFRLGLKPSESYLLHVGGNQWYKNRIGAVRIFARLIALPKYSNLRLVMVGKPWPEALRAAIRDENLGNRVLEFPDAGNEELRMLYSNAVALLFPSLEEGFGWPVLEAQACGCPAIVSNRPPMTEVAGDAAIPIDPLDPVHAAESIAIGLKERESLRAAGFRNLERFDEKKIVQQYLDFYAEILAGWRSSAY